VAIVRCHSLTLSAQAFCFVCCRLLALFCICVAFPLVVVVVDCVDYIRQFCCWCCFVDSYVVVILVYVKKMSCASDPSSPMVISPSPLFLITGLCLDFVKSGNIDTLNVVLE